MRLLFVNQYYWPDLAATSQMLTDLCEHLATQGHDVHVLCSTGHYDHGSRTPDPALRNETRAGVHIHRVTTTGFGKRSMVGRMIDYLSFHLLIGLRTLFTGFRYDAIVTLTTPPLIGVYATLVRELTMGRTRHVCWVMDLHPDVEFELGVFNRTSLLPRLLDFLNAMHLRRADHCVVLGPHMGERLVRKQVALDRISHIPVWGHELKPVDEPLPFEEQLQGKFVVMYSGNVGLAHTFDAICEAAHVLRDDDRFTFLFVGGGRRMQDIQAFQAEHDLANILITGYVPREMLGRSLQLGDVHLISLRDGMAGAVVPSKLYGIMAAARPVIFVDPETCETADEIRDANCGLAVATDGSRAMVDFLRKLAADPDLAAALGQNARRAFEQHFEPKSCCEQWRPLLESLAR